MNNLWIRIQALIIALAMALTLSGCNNSKEEPKDILPEVGLVGSLLENPEIADMTTMDEELRNGNCSITYTTKDASEEQLTTTAAFDRVMHFIDLLYRIPDLSEYKMYNDENPLSYEAVLKLVNLDNDVIDSLIEASKYDGKEFAKIEQAQEARRKLYGLSCYASIWLNKTGYDACKKFLGAVLKSSVADEFGVEIKDVEFSMTPYLETEEDKEDLTEKGILTITVNKDGVVKEFELKEKAGDPLFEVARAYSKSEFYATTRRDLTEEDYLTMLGFYRTAKTMLARGVNLSDGVLVPQNSIDYADKILQR